MSACSRGDLSAVEFLEDRGASHAPVSDRGRDCLAEAAAGNHSALVDHLLHNSRVQVSPAAIVIAAKCNHGELARTLISASPDRHLYEGAETPEVIVARAIPTVADKRLPLLEWVAAEGDSAGVDELLSYGWPPSPALSAAVANNHVSVARQLLAAGADANHLGLGGVLPPIVAACSSLNYEMVLLLLEHGADVNAVDTRTGTSALYATVGVMGDCGDEDGDGEGGIKIVRLLIDQGADVNLARTTGGLLSALIIASMYGLVDVIELLAAANADLERSTYVDSRRYPGGTAVMYAALWGHLEAVKCLVKLGCDPLRLDGNGKDCVSWCREGGGRGGEGEQGDSNEEEIVKFLVEQGLKEV